MLPLSRRLCGSARWRVPRGWNRGAWGDIGRFLRDMEAKYLPNAMAPYLAANAKFEISKYGEMEPFQNLGCHLLIFNFVFKVPPSVRVRKFRCIVARKKKNAGGQAQV